MNISFSTFKAVSLALALLWLTGCVQTKSVPAYARAGDIIVLGLGGAHRNAVSEPVLTVDDLTITLTDSASTVHNLQGLKTFKSYPDYVSSINVTALGGGATSLGLVPFDGGWFVTVPLTAIGDLESPLPLATGAATIAISSPKLVNTASSIEGDLDAIPIEIIPGTATYDEQYNDQFGYYSPSDNNFVISPDDLTGVDMVGGAYFVINYTDDSIFNSGLMPVVLPSNHNPFVQLSYNVVPSGTGTGGVIYVTLLNPAGFTTFETATNNTSLLADLTVKLQYFPQAALDVGLYKANFAVDIGSSYYIDVNGNLIAGMQPTMVHAVDL